ncbi:MAG: DUF120 domain-containing protein [Halobacteriota archaeon]
MPELERGSVKADALQALKALALEGAVEATVKISCSDLAETLDKSDQTVSRRLQSLEDLGLVTREMASDGQWIDVTDDGETVLRREYEDYRRVFEGPATVALEGELTHGMGEGSYYIGLDGYQEQFEERLGYSPYPGTFNVELTEESIRKRTALDSTDGVHIDEWQNDERTFGAATCYPAEVDGVKAHVIRPHRSHYPEDMLEVIARVKLVDELDVDHGDHVEVTVEL